MNLKTGKFIFIDCQTTGMRPPAGHLLELAWTYCSAEDEPRLQSHLVQLPEGHELPKMVSEITGIKDLTGAVELTEVFAAFQKTVTEAGAKSFAVIHYAQFEKPYLTDLYSRYAQGAELPFTILCSHQMTKKVFPNLPSQNIRGAAGFFGLAPNGLKRAGHHVTATHRIWRGVVDEVAKLGIHDLESLQNWLREAPKKKVTRYEYKIDKLKRLDLPDSPGVYRMISKSGEVLYVGKATSLKSRVNSYFRGKKGRDLRKLEMLAQVWDLQVTDCATPLEAALMESD
ncbi:MAG: GIY-YIG nuclease family protein, partial [Bdellovibrionales bacterium]